MPSFHDWSWSSGKNVVIRRMNSAVSLKTFVASCKLIWNINSRLRHRRIHTEELKQQLLPAFFYWIKNKSEHSWDLHNPSLPTQKKWHFHNKKWKCYLQCWDWQFRQKPIQQWTKPVMSIFHLPAIVFFRGLSACASALVLLPAASFAPKIGIFRRVFWVRIWVLKRFRQHSEFDDASD